MHNKYKQEIGSITNLARMKGSIEDAIVGADVFIGAPTIFYRLLTIRVFYRLFQTNWGILLSFMLTRKINTMIYFS